MPIREIDDALERAFALEHGPGAAYGYNPHPPISTPSKTAWCWPKLVVALEESHRDHFERLASLVLDAARRRTFRVLLITSVLRAEGRTTLAMALAKTLAKFPQRTLLVDADLGSPMIGRRLGIEPALGLEEVVAEPRRLSQAAVPIPQSHAAILPLNTPIKRPRALLASTGWSLLMAKLKREYEIVLLDGGPLFAGLSATALHRSAEAAILVHRPGHTSERSILRAREVLEAGGLQFLSLADNLG
jgi:Mrp family chromosome partitioning ATPase